MMKKESLFVLIILAVGILIAGCVSSYNQPNLITKTIQIKSVYPRTDGYLNHYPPYIVTTNGEIYDIDNDLLWAEFSVGEKYTIEYSTKSNSGRDRSGSIKNIVVEK